MRTTSLITLLLLMMSDGLSAQNQTDLEAIQSLFAASVNEQWKGPYGCYARQTTEGRFCKRGGGFPGEKGETLFFSAFRDEGAQQLAELDFYIANVFATNYHYLYAKNVVGDANSTAFDIDHEKFMANDQAMEDVQNVFRHTILERFYNLKFPDTKMAKTFYARGTASSEYEVLYLNYLAEYAARYMHKRNEYLTLYQVLSRYDLNSTSGVSINILRDEVDTISQSIEPEYKNEFSTIRNGIHNSLSRDSITTLEAFNDRYEGSNSNKADIEQLLKSLDNYFKVNADFLKNTANSLEPGLNNQQLATIASLKNTHNSVSELEALSEIGAELLTRMEKANSYPLETIRFIIQLNQYLQIDVLNSGIDANSSNSDIQSRMFVAINAAFSSGLIAKKQHKKLLADIRDFNDSVDVRDPARLLEIANFVSITVYYATENIEEMYGEQLVAWLNIEPAMAGMIDDTLKASLLIDLAKLSNDIKLAAEGPAGKRVMWDGVAYGYLKYISKDDMLRNTDVYTSLNTESIPVFQSLPLDLTVVAGVITEQPQTDLDHINLKSKQRNTPNMVFPNIMSSEFAELVDSNALVKMSLNGDDVRIEVVDRQEAEIHWQSSRPPAIGDLPPVRLDVKRVLDHSEIGAKDANLVGAKAANYAEIYNVLKDKADYQIVRSGFAIPFAYYDAHIKDTGIDVSINDTIEMIRAKNDPVETENLLAALREELMQTSIDPQLIADVQAKIETHYPTESVRFRSSTNSEDLANFSGAGLYTSTSYNPDKKNSSIEKAIKEVWASVWNRRAFDEREFYGINHETVFAAIQLNPGFPEEEGNGVAISRNITDVKSPSGLSTGVYFNNQKGEYSVTNPSPGLVAEEMIVFFDPETAYDFNTKYTERVYIKRSSETKVNTDLGIREPVFMDNELDMMVNVIRTLHDHFKQLDDPEDENGLFAIDVEYKVDDFDAGERRVYFKQARPFSDSR
ncbi:MAG: PEP/pyruvate-binding domain-containing protein [Lysobacterales bacterium]